MSVWNSASISARLVALALLAAPVCAQGYGSALRFNSNSSGGNRVTFTSRDAFNFGTADFTIEFWFAKPDSFKETVFNKRLGCGAGSTWAVAADTTISFGLRQGGVAAATSARSTTRIDDGAWHHFAGVRQGVTARVYVDGQLDEQSSGATVLDVSNTADVTFGTGPCDPFTGDPSRAFIGSVDEVMVWGEARTAAQIADDKRGTRTGAEPNLRLYWKLDEGSGQFAGDSSPNGVTGQLGISPSNTSGDPTWITSTIVAEEGGPEALGLLGAPRPNPVRGASALLPFETARAGPVHLVVVDVLGREVAVLVDGERPAGTQTARLDAGRLAGGVYVARLTAGGQTVSRVLTIVR